MKDDFLKEETRAEDILLGALGFGEEASIISVKETDEGYAGRGRWSDGEEFDFESDDGIDELERWAISIINKSAKP